MKTHATKLTTLAAGLTALALLMPVPAVHGQIEEIVVTAQRRAEDIQDVPISIQALSGEEILERGVESASDVTDLFVNVNTNAANEINSGFTIRGVGTNNFHGNVARAVGVYQDEVSRGTAFSGVLGVYDLERIEVLRGPQNTLFGRNTTGGAINYISRKPTIGEEGADGYINLDFGSENLTHFQGALGYSFGETFGVRFSGETQQRDGLFTNLAPGREGEKMGNKDRGTWRIQALWAPSENLEVLLNYHSAEKRGKNIGNKAVGIRDPGNPTARPGNFATPCSAIPAGLEAYLRISPCVSSFGENPSLNDWHSVYNVSSAISNIDLDGGFAKVTYTFGDFIFTSITAVDELTVLQADDNSGGPTLYFIPNQDAEYEQFSQELRLQGEHDGFRWIGGLYYFNEDMRLATIVRRDNNGGNTPPLTPGAGQITAYNFLDQNDKDLSIYGQGEFDLGDSTTLTLGMRYTSNEKEGTSLFGVVATPWLSWNSPVFQNQVIPPDQVLTRAFLENLMAAGNFQPVPQFNVVCGLGQGLGCGGKVAQDLNEVGYKASLDHTLDNDVLIYGSVSRGFKSGGFDTRALAALNGDASRPVKPETLDAFELGFKWENPDRTLRVNGAGFFNQWHDHQVFAVVDGIPALTNVPEAELYGAELEMLWAPDSSWLISANLGLLESEITDAGGLSGVDEGHGLRNTPDLSMNFSVNKYVPVGPGELNLFAKLRWQDEMIDNLRFFDDRYATHEAQTVIDVRATYEFGPDARYALSLWGENLTDEKYCLDIGLLDNSNNVGTVNARNIIGDTALTTTGNCSPSDGKALYGFTGLMRF